MIAIILTGGLGFVVADETHHGSEARHISPDLHESAAHREVAANRHAASRGTSRATPQASSTALPSRTPSPSPTVKRVAPVAGLTEAQMENARIIVEVGLKRGIPRYGLIIAVATAMQESNLLNLANGAVPESTRYPHQGIGWDHDSVGLFQQRSSTGWGPVRDLMRPEYAAEKFFAALEAVPNWQRLSLTQAAQAVQKSAFPNAYARHESRATAVVDALLP
ncbi:MAG TPA: hypothetical protein VIL44_02675 [Micromonospora sp.]